MKRRAAIVGLCAAASVHAQRDWRRVAVPYVTPQAWLRSLDERWYAPQSTQFAQAARRLAGLLDAACSVVPARTAWRDAMLAWEALAAVQTGALIERRSARAIDFTPTRSHAIERALAAPDTPLDRVGAPALGLPALEWLLWRAPLRDGSPACAYARRVASHLAAEADALAAAFAAPRERDEDAAQRDFATLVNQLVGGVSTLRWAQIGKPRREGRAQWPRAVSGTTRDAWHARMQALRRLLEFMPGADAPVARSLSPEVAGSPRERPGGGPVALEPFLRGRGLNALADRVRAASARAGAAVTAASPANAAAAERALGALEAVLANDVAPKLDVTIGFSDADGD